ncbi:MAG: Rieske 2Fe-2S domain-containing protein [Firmicutes bacterium]|nr:Rieske 2Fe-2S domain-containing protein [Bacillota bacterium]
MKQFVAEWSALQEKKKMRILWNQKPILLFSYDGAPYAISDKCPHMGASLFPGKYENGIIQCKDHALEISVVTGEVTDHQKADFLKLAAYDRSVRIYKVSLENGKVYLEV